MATLVPLNVFKSEAANLSSNVELLYTTPQDVTTIVLMAQVSNTSNAASNVTFFYKANSGPSTELVKGFVIYPNDAAAVLTGKLVLEEYHSIYAQAGHDDRLKIVLSLLETSNQ